MYESRWYDRGNAYLVLVMDPATSGKTWADVAARAQDFVSVQSPQLVDGVLFVAPWGKEQPPTTQAAYIDTCKTETIRLAQLAFTPATPSVVTLRS